MKILLTGSTGFLGRNLVALLEQRGHELWHLVRSPKIFPHEILWDFSSRLPEGIPCMDGVIHLAAKPYFGLDLDQEQYAVNVLSTGHLAQYAQANGGWLIFSSAAMVHGNGPLIRKGMPLGPLNHYAMTKMLAEELVKMWCREHCILRIGGIYGLDGPAHLGLNRSISEAFHNKSVPVLKGPSRGRRNYIAVSDMARWIAALVDHRQAGGRWGARMIYCSGPETMAIEDYLRSVAAILTDKPTYRREEGPASQDSVVEGEAPPFTLTRFDDYLRSLLNERKGS